MKTNYEKPVFVVDWPDRRSRGEIRSCTRHFATEVAAIRFGDKVNGHVYECRWVWDGTYRTYDLEVVRTIQKMV